MVISHQCGQLKLLSFHGKRNVIAEEEVEEGEEKLPEQAMEIKKVEDIHRTFNADSVDDLC